MFEIDLLKGQGIPIKSKPGGAALLAVTIGIPIIVAILMFGNYVQAGILLKTQKQFLKNVESDIVELSKDIEFQKTVRLKIININSYLLEVDNTLNHYVQWSPVLETMTRILPENLFLDELSIKTHHFREVVQVKDKSPGKKDSFKKVRIYKTKRVLTISMHRKAGRSGEKVVLEFLKNLSNSKVMKQKADNIKLISQRADEAEDTIYYVIECIFKSKENYIHDEADL